MPVEIDPLMRDRATRSMTSCPSSTRVANPTRSRPPSRALANAATSLSSSSAPWALSRSYTPPFTSSHAHSARPRSFPGSPAPSASRAAARPPSDMAQVSRTPGSSQPRRQSAAPPASAPRSGTGPLAPRSPTTASGSGAGAPGAGRARAEPRGTQHKPRVALSCRHGGVTGPDRPHFAVAPQPPRQGCAFQPVPGPPRRACCGQAGQSCGSHCRLR